MLCGPPLDLVTVLSLGGVPDSDSAPTFNFVTSEMFFYFYMIFLCVIISYNVKKISYVGRPGLILGWERSLENSYPLLVSCQEDFMDTGAWGQKESDWD